MTEEKLYAVFPLLRDVPLIYGIVGGSHLFGTNTGTSDMDIRLVHTSSMRMPRFLERDGYDVLLYSLDEWKERLAAYDGIAYEMLHAPDFLVFIEREEAKELRSERASTVTKEFVASYYEMNEREFVPLMYKDGKFSPKFASKVIQHLRVLLTTLETGQLQFYRDDRDELLAMKRGEWKEEELLKEIARLKREYQIWMKKETE